MNKKTSNITNQSGVALMMVMGAVSILSFLLAVFVYNVKINKIRLYNQIDKVQARLNAEAGISFALAKLELYQLGMNALEKNKSLKDKVSPRMLESIITQPFVFPIPDGLFKNANLIVKNAVATFTKSIKLDGELSVELRPVSGLLNPNNMRKVTTSNDENKEEEQEEVDTDSDDDKKEKSPPHVFMEKKLVEALTKAMDEKREEDDEFDTRYSNTDPKLLIKELKYYITDPQHFTDSELPDIENLYRDANVKPKHAPLISLSEMHLLQGWDDTLINLIKNQMSVHDVTVISLNEISKNQLEMLFPEIGPLQVEEFFKIRDGSKEEDTEPTEFKNVSEFKEVIVNRLQVVDEKTYNDRIMEFENAGIKLGVAGKLFKVLSVGKFGRATYTMTAYIDIPIKPPLPPKVGGTKTNTNTETTTEENQETTESTQQNSTNSETAGEIPPTEYMKPRVIELITGSE